jgi:hypothetical protein
VSPPVVDEMTVRDFVRLTEGIEQLQEQQQQGG